MRITLVTHVLPRLLAHVLAITSLRLLCHNLLSRTNFTALAFIISIILLGHILIYCPKFPTAAFGGVVFIPRVADLPLRSTKYHRLTKYIYKYLILIKIKNYRLKKNKLKSTLKLKYKI